jgi:hypothetical protein
MEIIIYQNPIVECEHEAIQEVPSPLQMQIDAIKESDEFTGLQTIDFIGTIPTIDFIQRIQKILPNRDRQSQLHFESDVLQDELVFKDYIIEKWYEKVKGRIGNVPVPLEVFANTINIEPVAVQPVRCMHALDRLLYTYRVERRAEKFLTLINIVDGQVVVKDAAEEALIKMYTVYADAKEQSFLTDIKNALTLLGDIEKKHNRPGITHKALSYNGTGYMFNNQILLQK